MTSPVLIFDFTANFLQSGIQTVFRSFRKSTVKPNLCATISPRGVTYGLASILHDLIPSFQKSLNLRSLEQTTHVGVQVLLVKGFETVR